jgi:hypothetical protein
MGIGLSYSITTPVYRHSGNGVWHRSLAVLHFTVASANILSLSQFEAVHPLVAYQVRRRAAVHREISRCGSLESFYHEIDNRRLPGPFALRDQLLKEQESRHANETVATTSPSWPL